MILSTYCESKDGKQRIELMVDYDPSENAASIDAANLFIEGKFIADISPVLDKWDGEPLSAMFEAIDWQELYQDSKEPEYQ